MAMITLRTHASTDSHVRIRYEDATPPVNQGQGPSHGATVETLGRTRTNIRIRLPVVTTRTPTNLHIPEDPGPYALVRGGLTEQVIDAPATAVQTVTSVEVQQHGAGIPTGPGSSFNQGSGRPNMTGGKRGTGIVSLKRVREPKVRT